MNPLSLFRRPKRDPSRHPITGLPYLTEAQQKLLSAGLKAGRPKSARCWGNIEWPIRKVKG